MRRPLPLPPGHTEETIRRELATLSIDGSPEGGFEGYLVDSFWRFLHTYGLAEGLAGRCLELGSNPYFITHLLRRYSGLDLTLANYFGPQIPEPVLVQQVAVTTAAGDRDVVTYTSHLFNLESEAFPFEDSSFEAVLFCEIIENLLLNPVHPLRQINRLLKDDGYLILTTPNVTRLENVVKMVAGAGIGDPYSQNGAYGRHNR